MDSTEARYLRRAIELSREAREHGDEPFGSLLVARGGRILAEERNTVINDRDLSAHPELKLAVWAGRHLDRETAATTTMYTSCENCAMCSAAMVPSGLGRLVFALDGTSMARIQRASAPAVNLSAAEVFARADRTIEVRGPLLLDEAAAVHEGFWPG